MVGEDTGHGEAMSKRIVFIHNKPGLLMLFIPNHWQAHQQYALF